MTNRGGAHLRATPKAAHAAAEAGLVPIHHRIAEQVRARPQAEAVAFDGARLTYGELEGRANGLAARLTEAGVGPDVLVAVCLGRGPDLIVSLLAVLKAGGAFLPLDPEQSPERVRYIIEDAAAKVALTEERTRGHVEGTGARVLVLDDPSAPIDEAPAVAPPAAEPSLDDLCYVIYTSGSTGRPKGVEVPHRGLANVFAAFERLLDLSAADRWLAVTTVGFDPAVMELLLPLCVGGTVCLAPQGAVLDPKRFGALLARERATVLQAVATTWRLLVDREVPLPRGLKCVTGGEALAPDLAGALLERGVRLWNAYGPTEASICATVDAIVEPSPITIGRAIDGMRAYVLDDALRPVPDGVAGELCLGGLGLARGYLGRPERTAQSFVDRAPDGAELPERLYRTGDLVRREPDGRLTYHGRRDHQVKIRGYRIELGEIEAALLALPEVAEAVVQPQPAPSGAQQLVAYLVAAGPTEAEAPALDPAALGEALRARLPDYMVPSAYVVLDALPLSANGKVDRGALPAPTRERPALSAPYRPPASALERALAGVWADVLGLDRVGIDDGFFDLGGTSVLAVSAIAALERTHGVEVPVVQLFAEPTVRGLCRWIEARDGAAASGGAAAAERAHASSGPSATDHAGEPVAIIGMAVRVSGAEDLDTFWQHLLDGVESIDRFDDDDLDPSVSEADRRDPGYVRARGVVPGGDTFDAAFFGVGKREAEITDPQQRALLELAWHALEDAGTPAGRITGRCGVFAGTMNNTYFTSYVAPRADLWRTIGETALTIANEKDYVASRVAYKLDLTGPAVSVHTACSTGLVAVHEAVQSLRDGSSDLALAGGMTLAFPANVGYPHIEGGMRSADGRCRPFDADASGTLFSDGGGLVVLRRLSDALAAGDRIYAVIRGTAINNDGARKVSYTAPSAAGQATVIVDALRDARLPAAGIGYVEAHGTGTALGDPIELDGLNRAFAADGRLEPGSRVLGAIKGNLGHLAAAAGVIGLIKTALAIEHGELPPTLHFRRPNPHLDFAGGPFRVSAERSAWPALPGPRRAGVSSFGVGGTNAHVVLEQAPERGAPATVGSGGAYVLTLSAKTEASVDAAADALAARLEGDPALAPQDVAFTLETGRAELPFRRAVVCEDLAGGAAALRGERPADAFRGHVERDDVSVAFAFPGQGAQHPGMGRSLYEDEAVYRETLDRCAAELEAVAGFDVRAMLHATDRDTDEAAAALTETRYTQPAIFCVSYAVARQWERWGVRPAAMIGHSIGELVAACLAGVLSERDALRFIAERGRLMQALPPGAMLSVRAAAADIETELVPGVALAAINGPRDCVVGGEEAPVRAVAAALERRDIACRMLRTSHAFHSAMMDPIVEPLRALAATMTLHPAEVPIVSSVTGDWLRPEQATDPGYWARHAREPVRFADAAARLFAETEHAVLDCGPRGTAAALCRRSLDRGSSRAVVAALGAGGDVSEERVAARRAFARLWVAGVRFDASARWPLGRARRVSLPGYAFERERYHLALSEPHAKTTKTTSPDAPPARVSAPAPRAAPASAVAAAPPEKAPTMTRTERLIPIIAEVLEETSGLSLSELPSDMPFVEMGLDSLLLTQASLSLKRRFDVALTFRQLMRDLSTPSALAAYLDAELPPDRFAAPEPPPDPTAAPAAPTAPASGGVAGTAQPIAALAMPVTAIDAAPGTVQAVIAQQLELMQRQLALLGAAPPVAAPAPTPAVAAPAPSPVSAAATPPAEPAQPATAPEAAPTGDTTEEPARPARAFGAQARIEHAGADQLTPRQQKALARFTEAYVARTRASKDRTAQDRPHLADPRVVTGFHPLIKELTYPLLVDRSKGSRVWDIDGNEYIDVTCGFGADFLGHSCPEVIEAVHTQLDRGIEIGPQHPLAGEVTKLICEMTGHERAVMCNTGSEAVMGAMRLARTVSGKKTIAMFDGDYHGIFDEVIVRGSPSGRSFPASAGILREAVANTLVLEYGAPESLRILRERADTLAAVLVEPVQSRNVALQPKAFLRELRELTAERGVALIFDEVITGFRIALGGAQAHFGVKADLATYGKILGGGLPIGGIAGSRKYMDALDGGAWRFGDDSTPEVGVTYFAGTFVRHPLALAASKAALSLLKERGDAMLDAINARTAGLVERLNAHFTAVDAPLRLSSFSSVFRLACDVPEPMPTLFAYYLRYHGIHAFHGRTYFLTIAHTDADVAAIEEAFKRAASDMSASGLFPPQRQPVAALHTDEPPVPGARLGRDRDGKPAWFAPDADRPGQYKRVG
ncbi:MAG: amino acid adenylation domain-containing protein [Myxococcales bacterium]|nr:amino acid adenylation domain-containing protein [Myxococcales bacterium]